MCYDIESSLSAWFISNIIAIYLYNRNKNYDHMNASFIVTFSTVQLLEAGIWWVKPEGLPSYTNEILTKSILLVLLMQPLIQSYFGYKSTNNNILKYMTFIYVALLLWGFYRLGKSNRNDFYTKTNSQNHLVWYDKQSLSFLGGNDYYVVPLLYLGGLFIPLLFQKDNRGLPLITVGVGSFIFSSIVGDNESFSSLWCFYSVIYSVVAIYC